MKLTYILLSLFGTASAVDSLLELGDGLWSVSATKGYPDFNTAVRIDNTTYLPADDDDDSGGKKKGPCLRILKEPVYVQTRPMDFDRAEYDRARQNFIQWLDRGPGRVEQSSCKYSVIGTSAVGACTYGFKNPVCAAEFDTAMVRADLPLPAGGCGAQTRGCAVLIPKWKKIYCRINTMEARPFGHSC
ncbi:hypothetical protein F5X99DRAFT_391045 [Biscogniauxia marginata]|nr:hypothetical protein F5X99DRAFT_391045 [Biscogniauxia marginata]